MAIPRDYSGVLQVGQSVGGYQLEREVARCCVSRDFGRAIDELNVVELCSSKWL